MKKVQRFNVILSACWNALDRAIEAVAGKELRKGTRGGGRDLKRMISHVIEAE